MNKLDFQTPDTILTINPVSHLDRNPSRRLIVLIPANSDWAPATRRVWELAKATGSTVQLLGLCKDISQEPALRRELVTMAALIRDAKISVETKVEIGANWVDVVKRNYQLGDMIVCMAEQRAGIRHRPLSQILESNLKAPVYILSQLQASQPQSNGLSQAIKWLGLLGIIFGFFLLQVRVDQLSKDWFQTVLLILLLIPEFGLIWLWNNLFE